MKQCFPFCPCNRCEQRQKNIEAAELLKVAESAPRAPYIVRGTVHSGAKLIEEIRRQNPNATPAEIGTLIHQAFELAPDMIDDASFKAGQRHAVHRIAKLAITLITRVVLVVGIAALPLAVFA